MAIRNLLHSLNAPGDITGLDVILAFEGDLAMRVREWLMGEVTRDRVVGCPLASPMMH